MNRSFGGTLDCNNINYNKGKSFRFSEWNSSTLFSNDDYIQDFVSYMGSMYACIQTNTGVEPTNELYWKLVVSGQPGIQGKTGNTGVTFTPHVDSQGNLSWTNDGGLENPTTVNIKGPKGEDSTVPGPKGDKGDDGIGLMGPQGRTGEMGIGLEFNWDGTKLGIKRTVDDEYTYVDLKGTTGSRGLRGLTGNTGPEGPQGPKGDSLYIQVSEPNEFGQRFLQKRYSENEAWVSFFDLSQMKGPKGDSIIVERNTETGNIEYRYQNQPSTANKVLIYKDDIKGPKGDTIAKTYVADDGYLYIQLSGEDLPRRVGYVRGDRGADGREIILRVYTGPSEDPNDPRIGTHLQWKYAGDDYKLWTNLIQINDLMNVALAGLKLEYKTITKPNEVGIETKYEVIELSHYQVEFDEDNNLVLTEKIANLSSVKVPTKTLLRDIKYDYDNNKLIFVFDTATGDEEITIDCDQFIRQGNGITISNGNIINVNISDDSDKLADDSEILICDERGVAVCGLKDKLIKEFDLLKHDRNNNTHYYSYEYIAQDGTVYPISIPDFVEWNDNQDQTRQIFFRNQDKLVSWDIDKIIRNLIHLDGSDIVQVGDSKVSMNLNGKDANPTYNINEKLALISNLEDEIAGLHLVKEDTPGEPDIAARYYLVDKDGERLGDVHIDILKDNYLKDVTYNEDTYTFTFDFWVNDDPEEPAHDRVITFTLQKLFDNLKTLIDNLEAKHDSDIQTIRDEHKQDVKTLNETIATVNENLVISVNNINQAMIDGFNTINGGINNEIRPAIAKNAEDIELLRENLEQEATDRKAADNVLQSNIDAEVKRASEAEQMLQTNINSEVNRALEAEKLLQDNINTEVARATNAEQTIQTSLDEEISRSKQKDQELIAKTDKTNQDLLDTNNNLSAEILRATNAESEIYDHIHKVEAKIDGKIDSTEKGQPNGVATLDENGFIPSTQINGQMARVFGVDGVATAATLPDSVKEGDIYYTTDTKKFYNYNGTTWDDPMDPKDDTIYNFRNSDATGDTSRTNILYRWDGENLTEISESLALGEVTGTAYEGNKGAANRAAINSTPESLLSTLNISSDTSKVDVTLETATKSGLNYNEVTSVVKNIPNATRLSAGVITSAEHTSLVETIPNKLVELETELNYMDGVTSNVQTQLNEIKESVDSISDPYEINLTNLLSAEDSESISSAIGGIDNLNATVQDNRIIVGTISNGNVSVSIRILGNVTTLYYLLDSVVGLTLNEVKITNTSGTLSKSVTTHSVLTENMVINSLNSDETTLPLSAAQGKILATDKQDKTDDNLNTENKTIVGAINEILPKATGVGKIDPNSNGTGEIFNDYPRNKATGHYAHAEGQDTKAIGAFSHAEGQSTTAKGSWSHVEGCHNFVISDAIHTVGIGDFYKGDKNAHVILYPNGDHFIIGIGGYKGQVTDSAQSLQEVVNGKQDTLTAGTGIDITPENQINVTLDTTVFFVAETAPVSPSEDQKKKICLVPADTTEEGNFYTEYVWVVDDTHPEGYWEEFGTYKSEVDLTDYLKTSDAESTYLKITDAEIEYATKTELSTKQNATDNTLDTEDKTIVGAINEILPKATGVGKIDPNSYGNGEIFNDYSNNKASGAYAHAECDRTEASGYAAHAEGYASIASGLAAHAEGSGTTASGDYAHAEGSGTTASGDYAHAEGKYNFDDSSVIHMVGIGTSNTDRKNAHVIKREDGSQYIIGIGGYEGQATDSAQSLQEVINGLNSKSDVYVIDYLYIVGNAQNPDQELLDNALGGWDNLVNAIQTHKAIIAKQSFDGMEANFSVVASVYEPLEGGETISMLVQVSEINIYGIILNRDSSDTVSVTIKPIRLNALDVLDVSTLFADSATITSELSSQIANYGKSSAPDFPVFNAGTSIGNIKPTWIRTSGGVTNFMCIADNKIWYFEIQGTTVQRAELAIS